MAVHSRMVALIVVSAVTFSGCGGSSTGETAGNSPDDYNNRNEASSLYPTLPPSEAPPVLPTASVSTSWTHQTSAADCRDRRYTRPLSLRAESVDEVESLKSIAACTNATETATWLGNRSDVVWRIYAGPVEFRHSPHTSAQQVVRRVAGNAALMEPGSGVEVIAPPSEVNWYADPALTAVFASTVELEKKVWETAIGNSPRVLRERSRARANLTCGVAVYNAASAAASVNEAKSDDERAMAMFEGTESVFSGATDCRKEIEQADAEQVRKQQIVRGVLPQLEATSKQLRFEAIARPIRTGLPFVAKNVIRVFS